MFCEGQRLGCAFCSAFGKALGAFSERSRLRSRSAFGTHSDQTRNALGSALGAPSVTPSDRLRKPPFGAHSGVVAERPRQRPRNGRSELVPNPLRGRLEAILEAAWFSGPFNSLGFLFSYLYMLRLKAPLLILTYKNKKFRCADAQIYAQAAGPASFRRCTTIAHGLRASARVRIQTVPRPRATRGGPMRAPDGARKTSNFFSGHPCLPGHRILAWSSHPCLVIFSLCFLLFSSFYIFRFNVLNNFNI